MTTQPEHILVPREPTGEMLDAAIDAHMGFDGEDQVDAVWTAMLAAAPHPIEPCIYSTPEQENEGDEMLAASLAETVRDLERELAAKQARIDELMLDLALPVHSPAPDSVSNGGEQTRPSSPGAGDSAIESLRLKFTSGNSTPVERATITRAEFDAIAALLQPSCMTRDVAIYIARLCAYAKHDSHSYLPQTRDDAKTWQPHEWVVDAIRWADAQPDEQP